MYAALAEEGLVSEEASGKLSSEQQTTLLDAIIGEAGMSRLYMSLLTSRAGEDPERYSMKALDRDSAVIANWVIRHHIAVAAYELMLEERMLIDVDEEGQIYFIPLDVDEDATAEELEKVVDDLLLERTYEHFTDERRDVQSIPREMFVQVYAAIERQKTASGQVQSLAPKARRDSDEAEDRRKLVEEAGTQTG
jgi:hypothetical protein